MGGGAAIYDAEMLALMRGMETTIEYQKTLPEESRAQSHTYCLLMLRLYDLFQYTITRAPLRSIPAVRPDRPFGPAYGTQYRLAE